MGLSATFTASVTGNPVVSYQWFKNGVVIPGAINSGTYVTPTTSFADDGSTYSLKISNSLGSATSSPATLTVTARAPQQGDLRFQQVDAPSTISGYTGEEGTDFVGWDAISFGDATGTPLSIGPGCPAGGGDRYSCQWELDATYLPAGLTGLGTYYQGFWMDSGNFETQLGTLNNSTTVLTGIDVEPLSDIFAASWIVTSTGGGFDATQHTVSPANFQAEAATDGANGRVITAVSWYSGQILYLSYGWTGNAGTTYDIRTATATFDTIGTVAKQLSAEGYIITALGGTAADGLLLVGTKVHGDTLPRPFLFQNTVTGGNPNALANGGYAIIGFLVNLDSEGNLLANDWIGQR
jgi:hypothetical protein